MRQDEQRASQLIPQLWAERLLEAQGILSAAARARKEERAWLVQSLRDDLAPDWLIEMVLERWNQQ